MQADIIKSSFFQKFLIGNPKDPAEIDQFYISNKTLAGFNALDRILIYIHTFQLESVS